jgi:hypothetical protein
MTTNLSIDDNLLEEAKKESKYKTKNAVVTEALQEYIQRRKQIEIANVFATIYYDESYDYKQQRNITSSP